MLRIIRALFLLVLLAVPATAQPIYTVHAEGTRGEMEEGHRFDFAQTSFPHGGLVFGPMSAEAVNLSDGIPNIPVFQTAIPGDSITLPAHQLLFPIIWGNSQNANAVMVSNTVDNQIAEIPSIAATLTGPLPEEEGECRSNTADFGGPVDTTVLIPPQTILVRPLISDIPLPDGVGFDFAYRTEDSRDIPVNGYSSVQLNICRVDQSITGTITITFKFNPTSVFDATTGWSHIGQIGIVADEQPGGAVTGALTSTELENTPWGELVSVATVTPQLAATFSRDDKALLIDLSPTAGPFPNSVMNFVVQGRPSTQSFPNLFAVALGRLVQAFPGPGPRTMALPIMEAGQSQTMQFPMGQHAFEITFSLSDDG